jgi:hypothetical protein
MKSVTKQHRKDGDEGEEIVQRALALLETHANFRGRAARFQFFLEGQTLVVRGSVPTFYLKQVLQTVLKDIEGVRRIENEVQVVSTRGLSDVPKR